MVYALLPTLIAVVLWRAREHDPNQLGYCLDFAVLLILGLIVEFRRFEPGWPAESGAFNRIGSLLRPGVAVRASHLCLSDYPRLRRHYLATLVALNVMLSVDDRSRIPNRLAFHDAQRREW